MLPFNTPQCSDGNRSWNTKNRTADLQQTPEKHEFRQKIKDLKVKRHAEGLVQGLALKGYSWKESMGSENQDWWENKTPWFDKEAHACLVRETSLEDWRYKLKCLLMLRYDFFKNYFENRKSNLKIVSVLDTFQFHLEN